MEEGKIVFGAGPLSCDTNRQGDIDGDGQVTFTDFLILSDTFGDNVELGPNADFDCDGVVAFADFLVLSNNFGQSVRAEATHVPEPTAWCLFGTAVLVMALGRRRTLQRV